MQTYSEWIKTQTLEQIFASWDRDILPLAKIEPKKGPKEKKYLITFTYNSKASNKYDWYILLKNALSQSVHTYLSATIEHIESNIHCHAVVGSKYNLSKDRYKKFATLHRMDFKTISYDNGVNSYIAKENPKFDNFKDFIDYFDLKILDNNTL